MRVESKIQEKKIKIFKQGEFVEDKGYITFPIYSFGNSDEEYSYEDSIKRKAEIIASYYFDNRNTSDIRDIYVSLYNTQLSEENAKTILKEKSNEIIGYLTDYLNLNDYTDITIEDCKLIVKDIYTEKIVNIYFIYNSTENKLDGKSRNIIFMDKYYFYSMHEDDIKRNKHDILRFLLIRQPFIKEENPIFIHPKYVKYYINDDKVEQGNGCIKFIKEKDNNYETYKYDIIPVNITKGFIETKEKNEDKQVVSLEKYSDNLYKELSNIPLKDNTTIRREKVIGMIQDVDHMIKEKYKSNKKDSGSYFDNWMINLCEEFNNTQSCNQTLNERLQIMSLIKDTISLIKDEGENPNIYKGLYKGLFSSDDKQDTEKPNESVRINDPNYYNYLRNGCIKIGKIYKTLYYYNGDFSLKRELYMRYCSRLEIESGFDFFNSIKQYLENVKNIFPTKIFYIGTINGFVISDKPYMDEISHLFLIKTLDRELKFVSIVEYKDPRYEKTYDEQTWLTKYEIDTDIPTAILRFFDKKSKGYINDIVKKYF